MRSSNGRLARLMPLIALLAAACMGGQTGSEAKGRGGLGRTDPCEPLGPSPEPLELGEVLAVGRDTEGTLYVVDRDPNEGDNTEMRAFVSQGETLVRQRVLGTGSNHLADSDLYQLKVEASPAYNLVVEQTAAGAIRMARTEQERPMSFDQLAAADHLEVVDLAEIDGMPLRDLPGDIRVEYLARTPDGSLLVVLVPEDDFSYDKFRLFFGPAESLIERELDDVQRARDGGSTHLLFDLDGDGADAFFPVMFDGTNFAPGPATLKIGSETVPLDRLDPTEDTDLLYAVQFRCLK